jgi:hypothetical protein
VQIAAGRVHQTSLAEGVPPSAPLQTPNSAANALDSAHCKWASTKSVQVTWEAILGIDPDILLVSCCGFALDRNVADARRVLSQHPVACRLRAVRDAAVFAVDGNRFLARPGPALVQGAAAVAAATWHRDSVRRATLEKTGLLPEEGVMWGRVEVPLGGALAQGGPGKENAQGDRAVVLDMELEGVGVQRGGDGGTLGDIEEGAAPELCLVLSAVVGSRRPV